MKPISKWLLSACALLALAHVLPSVRVDSFVDALLAAILIAFLNTFIRPVLVLLTLPVTVLSVGLFLFVINAVLFWVASRLLGGFEVTSFAVALLGSLIYSLMLVVIDFALEALFRTKRT